MWIDDFLFMGGGSGLGAIANRQLYLESEDRSLPRLRGWLPAAPVQEVPGIYLDNDFEFERRVFEFDSTTGARIPHVGELPIAISGFVARNRNDTGPIGSLTVHLYERADVPGMYFGSFTGAAVRSSLGAYAGRVVWLRLAIGASDYLDSVPFHVYGSRITGQQYLPLDNDFEIARQFYRKNADSGLWEPATGLTDVVGYIAPARDSTTVLGGLTLPLVERGTTGQFVAALPGLDLRSMLQAYTGKPVFSRVRVGSSYLDAIPALVQDVRPAA